jgi:hypothetical protein
MISRYSLMRNSLTESDSVDTQIYPDILTVDFGSFSYTEPPFIVDVDDRLQQFPYLITNAFYKQAAYDDIVFSINNIPHTSLLQNASNNGLPLFSTLKFPTFGDLNAFINGNK